MRFIAIASCQSCPFYELQTPDNGMYRCGLYGNMYVINQLNLFPASCQLLTFKEVEDTRLSLEIKKFNNVGLG